MKLTDLNKLPDRDLIAELRVTLSGLAGNEATYNLVAADTTASGAAILIVSLSCTSIL